MADTMTGLNGSRRAALPATAAPPVSLVLPTLDYVGVARLVAAGVATRLGLRFEAVDNLQTAMESVFPAALCGNGPATVEIASDAQRLTVSIGPVAANALERRFGDGGLDLSRLLDQLVDAVTVAHEPVSSIALHVDLAASRT
jgi:hypothetical protein